ncbi:MAG: Exopolysaccharide biosynthesis domain protein [Myxococcaceae bacterium]|nr:Exopolysaccharide biosynthesis domain protein [Myxococcaceae bacterium]
MREPGRRDEEDQNRHEGHKPSSLRAVLDALRSIPERMKRPESMLMILMIMASIGAHMPPYLSLGALADYFKEKEKEELAAKKEPPVTFEVLDPPKPEEPKPPEPRTPKERQAKKAEEKKKKVEEQKKAEEEKKQLVELQKPEPPQPTPPPPKPREDRKQSITQKSADPSVEPPPDTKYLAEESQRVEEETVASVTSETKNDPDPQAAAPQAAGAEKSGDSRTDERGAEKGQKVEQQQQVASRERSQDNNPRPPAPNSSPSLPNQPQAPGKPGPVAPKAPAEQVFHDPLGSFTLAASDPSVAPAGSAGSGAAGKAANIKVSWHAFEETFGAEQLAQDRMPKEAKRRGAGREKRWEEFRASIENYVVGVKPGNQTKLNAAADPFAAYLAAFHRNLHIEFAHDFLSSLPAAGDLANPNLVTTVEIVINADGSLDRVGVVKASGNLMYDFGAFNAVQRGAPYPPTPEKIRSPDGRVYIKWALHHNESQCGTWNAEPFILKNPPRSPNDPKQDNVSPYRPGGETEHGQGGAPKRGAPSNAPAVSHDETLGLFDPRVAPVRG